MKLLEKLLSIQMELKAPKSQFNSFGKYKYRNCEDILEAVKPLCTKYKTVLTISDDVENVNDRYYIKATATLYDVESEEKMSVSARAREEEKKTGMDGSQVTGASSSYARKYALNGLFSIDDTKDSDATNLGDNNACRARKYSVDKCVERRDKSCQNGNNAVLSDTVLQLKKIAEIHGYELDDVEASCREWFNKTIDELTDDELAQVVMAYSKE